MSRILLGAWAAGFGLLLSGVEICAAQAQTVTHVGNITGNVAAGKQDYRRYCVGCHGPSQQQAGFRLDRKSSVMKTFSKNVIERFKVTDGGKTLQVTIHIEDPGAFNMPWSARQTFHRTRTGKMEEAICAENNFALDASVSEIPKADKPDF